MAIADKEPGMPELRAAFERHMQSTGMYWDSDRDWDADGDEQYADVETRLNFDVWCAAHESGRAQARAEWVAELKPWAYAAFVENGNTPLWRHAKDLEAMKAWAAEHAPGAELIELAIIPKE